MLNVIENIMQQMNISSSIASPITLLILIVLSAFLAKISDLIITFIFKRAVNKTKTNLDNDLIEALHKPIYYSIFFTGIVLSIDSVANLPMSFDYIVRGIFRSITIVVWSVAFIRMSKIIIKWVSQKNKFSGLIHKRTLPLFDNLAKIVVFIFSIYFVCLSWSIDVTGWVASAGILSVVIGFAAKDTLSNLFAGIFIMADAPYKEGDYINLDSGERGYVRSIGIRSTRIMTRDDIEITIPNALIANSKIVNESGGPDEKERVRITLEISYNSDIDIARKTLFDIANSSEHTCKDPEPRVRFREFGESGLVFQLLFWIEKPELRGRIIDKVSTNIFWKFKEENIEIPYPQRTLHVKKENSNIL
tara:strand:+ start:1038 stop:2123 length:1086 start_codon:yes stop_codon:yes gene_type:complete